MAKKLTTNGETGAKNAGLSADFIEKVKKMLLDQKEKVKTELKKYEKGDEAAFPDYGDSEEDNAHEVADYEANLTIEQDLEKTLRDIDGSLSRIEKGTYGICKYCHKSIEEKRLLARPTSSACVACKKAIVQEA